jgi:hypothetical protein
LKITALLAALLLAPIFAVAQTVTVAPVPPACSGPNQALGWSGTGWTCQTISGGGGGSSVLQSTTIAFTRDPYAASGSVSYACGFQPTAVFLIGGQGGGSNFGFGFSDQAKTSGSIYDGNGHYTASALVVGINGANQSAVVSSLDPTGFTLIWTRNGSPGGPLFNIFALCLR